jgi:hypothetical protein
MAHRPSLHPGYQRNPSSLPTSHDGSLQPHHSILHHPSRVDFSISRTGAGPHCHMHGTYTNHSRYTNLHVQDFPYSHTSPHTGRQHLCALIHPSTPRPHTSSPSICRPSHPPREQGYEPTPPQFHWNLQNNKKHLPSLRQRPQRPMETIS